MAVLALQEWSARLRVRPSGEEDRRRLLHDPAVHALRRQLRFFRFLLFPAAPHRRPPTPQLLLPARASCRVFLRLGCYRLAPSVRLLCCLSSRKRGRLHERQSVWRWLDVRLSSEEHDSSRIHSRRDR
ncbi:hypothetical protein L202_06164 [Cryptococcus amylolentus CBS 6039]|uniref:Uncharacterized protein n=1 Tax=Cryptococcus amylolentus CBS 6039 TaxID=1295533 RepID=A0A1E3HIR4_9TREE|nr:hypothetical protein L202_06164 [Cryptococcus amylolentus CBS 6039]ODN76242.1 hypothetical protein L202_06164 [Cryptococcus amylolentus CBS 6039]